jgi:phosphoglycolate phosphatase
MRRPTILLFDIDGTLVTTGGAGRRAMERAFESKTGLRSATDFPFAGMTDRAIVRNGLLAASHPDDEPRIDEVIDLYLEYLEEEVDRATFYDVYPGVVTAVRRALAAEATAVGLGTGNVKRGARIKLGRVDLADSFAFGGFGCDDEDRATLLRIGAERGASRLGAEREDCRVVVIGDTPRDVAAALAIGAECIGVGTGGVDPAELRELGATASFATLDDPGALDALLGRDQT